MFRPRNMNCVLMKDNNQGCRTEKTLFRLVFTYFLENTCAAPAK